MEGGKVRGSKEGRLEKGRRKVLARFVPTLGLKEGRKEGRKEERLEEGRKEGRTESSRKERSKGSRKR